MVCKHFETDITHGRFQVGDRVSRPIDIWDEDSLLKTGTVVRAYTLTGCENGPYPELYDVRWDWAFIPSLVQPGRGRISGGYLPHGIDPVNVFKATYWILHPELLDQNRSAKSV